MSDESASSTPEVSTPNLAGDWGDESPVEAENEASEPSESQASPKVQPEAKEAPKPKPAAPKLIEFNGKKWTEAELSKELEKAKGADQRFREAAEQRKHMEAFLEQFQRDPLSVLKDKRLSINQRELAEKMLLESLEEEMLTPEQRKLREYEGKLKEFESKEQQIKREAEEREAEQRKELKRQEIGQLFAKAMESTPLSKDPETAAMAMRDMAMMLRVAKERGLEVGAEELAKHAEAKYQKAMYSLANTLEGEDLISFLGEEVVKKIRKADLARLKANNQPMQSHKDEDWEAPKAKQDKGRLDPYAAREHARKLLFGK
jgi:hypothetical protein